MSKSFKEIVAFNVGEQYMECSSYGDISFEVMTKPKVIKSGKYTQVSFEAVSLDSGEPIDYLLTKGLEHYGPSIYDILHK